MRSEIPEKGTYEALSNAAEMDMGYTLLTLHCLGVSKRTCPFTAGITDSDC